MVTATWDIASLKLDDVLQEMELECSPTNAQALDTNEVVAPAHGEVTAPVAAPAPSTSGYNSVSRVPPPPQGNLLTSSVRERLAAINKDLMAAREEKDAVDVQRYNLEDSESNGEPAQNLSAQSKRLSSRIQLLEGRKGNLMAMLAQEIKYQQARQPSLPAPSFSQPAHSRSVKLPTLDKFDEQREDPVDFI
jgi:hypothetical protein